ncbi:MAG: hypothetical protein ABI411_05115 [Tahibacter sp.]
MKILKRALKGTCVVIFLFLLYVGTITYVPCSSYPFAYLQAQETGGKIEAFRSKYQRLPDFSNRDDVAELGLGTGYFMRPIFDGGTFIRPISDRGSYTVSIDPSTSRDFTFPFNEGVVASFDTPWVNYNPGNRSITCGHR